MYSGLSVGHFQHVDRLVERGVGVDVGAETHPDGLQVVDDLLLLEPARAVEGHVLQEVGQALLIVVFLHGPGVDRQPEGHPLLRLTVDPDEVAQAVVQTPLGNGRVQGQRVGGR